MARASAWFWQLVRFAVAALPLPAAWNQIGPHRVRFAGKLPLPRNTQQLGLHRAARSLEHQVLAVGLDIVARSGARVDLVVATPADPRADLTAVTADRLAGGVAVGHVQAQ